MTATLKLTHKAIGVEVRRGTYDIVVDGQPAATIASGLPEGVQVGDHAACGDRHPVLAPLPPSPPTNPNTSPTNHPPRPPTQTTHPDHPPRPPTQTTQPAPPLPSQPNPQPPLHASGIGNAPVTLVSPGSPT